MSDARINELSEYLYNLAFQMLDNEPEMSGEDAGRVATAVQKRFESAIAELDD